MEYLRKKYVCRNQVKKGIKGVREAIDHIKRKNCLALMIDQRVSEGEKINLFNEASLTTTLPAQFSLKFGIDIKKRVKHDALLDSQILSEVYLELIGGKQPGFIFQKTKEEVALNFERPNKKKSK